MRIFHCFNAPWKLLLYGIGGLVNKKQFCVLHTYTLNDAITFIYDCFVWNPPEISRKYTKSLEFSRLTNKAYDAFNLGDFII